MSRRKHTGPGPRSDTKKGADSSKGVDSSAGDAKSYVPSPAAIRETIESIVIAFVLAFLFRTFEAEAFVIPTGSMAPTLMGRHKDLVCPECGFPFQVSASEEVNPKTNAYLGEEYDIVACTCPMCRFPIQISPDDRSFKGDRILVNKSAYQFSNPSRWDVAVFKYPGEAATNFIKRLVGLPNETIRIHHGDLWITPKGEKEEIARKPPYKLRAMLQPVYDNDYQSQRLIQGGWPARWQSLPGPDAGTGGTWTTSADFKSFSTTGSPTGETWLRYQHYVPSFSQWKSIVGGMDYDPALRNPRPQLISDFCYYNTGLERRQLRYSGTQPECDSVGLYWVGDLALQCRLEVEKPSGQAVFELVEGGRHMQCRIDLVTGQATLSISGLDDFGPTAETSVRAVGSYEIVFSNVDDELLLWVDGDVVQFDAPTTYGPLNNFRPDEADLRPAGIASVGEAALKVSGLKLFRDIYYIAEMPDAAGHDLTEYDRRPFHLTATGIAEFLSNPSQWDAFRSMREATFQLEADQFFMLGDNSPKSKDSRLWAPKCENYVERNLLIGKALYIYWPHSWDKIPGTDIPLPMFPNFERMGFVR